ncbi:MAG: ABC transporter permease [Mariprofundaceae bacterium]
MSRILTLCWKEWRITMDTPMGYVVAAAFLLASGFFFGNNLFLIGQADMRGYFSVVPLLLMFFVPAMTMRMLADEQRSGTFELLATMPARTIDIVLGKYLSVLVQVSVLLAFTLVYPLSLSLLGDVDGGQIAAAYLAAMLLAAAYVAVCLYASSLSNHAVVSYVAGFGMLLALFLTAQAAPTFSPAVQDWIAMTSPLTHYQYMLRGVLGLDDIVLLLLLNGIFLALTWFQLERRRWR